MSESDQVTEQGLDPAQLAGAVEALLIMAEEPLPAVSLASALHVTVDEGLTVGEAHEVAEHISEDIRECVPNSDVLVHIEPRSHDRVDGS